MDIPDTYTSSEGYVMLHVCILSLLEVMLDMIWVGGAVGKDKEESQVAPDVPT
jgi:hypothetical protein